MSPDQGVNHVTGMHPSGRAEGVGLPSPLCGDVVSACQRVALTGSGSNPGTMAEGVSVTNQ